MPLTIKCFFASVTMLSALGCGGGNSADRSLCDNLETATTSAASKAAPCSYTPPALGFTPATCRATISNCGDSDQQRIRDVTTCLDALPTCSPATLASWTASYQTCASMVGPLAGQGC
jgi:hypothetical protein